MFERIRQWYRDLSQAPSAFGYGVRGRIRNALRGLEELEDRTLLSTFTWTNGAGTNLWSSFLNWKNDTGKQNAIPKAADTLVFDGNQSVANAVDDLLQTINTVKVINNYSGQITISTGSLDITKSLVFDGSDKAVISGVAGATVPVTFLSVTGLFVWSHGGFMGPLGVRLGQGTGATAQPCLTTIDGGNKTNTGLVSIANQVGAMTWKAGNITGDSTFGGFSNAGTFDIQCDNTLDWSVTNSGKMTKSSGNGTTTFKQGVENSGTITLSSGTRKDKAGLDDRRRQSRRFLGQAAGFVRGRA